MLIIEFIGGGHIGEQEQAGFHFREFQTFPYNFFIIEKEPLLRASNISLQFFYHRNRAILTRWFLLPI